MSDVIRTFVDLDESSAAQIADAMISHDPVKAAKVAQILAVELRGSPEAAQARAHKREDAGEAPLDFRSEIGRRLDRAGEHLERELGHPLRPLAAFERMIRGGNRRDRETG